MLSVIIDKFTCPNCSVQTELKISRPLYVSCPSCRIVYNFDKEKNVIKTFFPERNLQPIKTIELATTGTYQDKSFQLVGHIRSVNTNSVSNEWLMKFGDGKEMWLIENGFNYFVFESEPIVISSGLIKGKKVGNIINIQSSEYTIVELSKQIEFQMEGQIPENCFNDQAFFKFEAIGESKDKLISICIFDDETIEAYKGVTIQYMSLKLSNADKFKNWI